MQELSEAIERLRIASISSRVAYQLGLLGMIFATLSTEPK
jgi:hypothetical protein